MAQVISENSITMSPARRRFLTFAAGASVASVGSLAAASLPIAIPAKAAADPILDLIETHRKAHAAHMAALQLQNRFERKYGAGQGSWISTKPCHDEHDVFEEFIAAPATTLPGLLAKLDYMEELSSEFETEWMIEERAEPGDLFRSFAESIANITPALSGGEA